MNRQIIITSDDFGLSSGVNRAVEKAWREGILTCASLMPAGNAFDEALEIARRNPGMQVGLHLTLVQGNSVLPHEQIPGLTDESGAFTDNPVRAGMSYFFDRSLFCQLKREIEAQISRIADSGIRVTHVDGHLNIHMHPTVFRILTELMPRYGISSFRLSREQLTRNLRINRSRLLGKSVEKVIFGALADRCRPMLDTQGIRYAGEVLGVFSSGQMTEDYLLAILDSLCEGLTEIYFHPGILPDSEITRRMPDYRHAEELAALTSSRVRQKLETAGIELVNYRGDKKIHV